MSLLNDMLKDLDSGARSNEDSSKSDALMVKPKRSIKALLLPILAAVFACYFIVFELNIFGWFPASPASPVEMPGPVQLNSKWLTSNPQAAGPAQANDTPVNTTASSVSSISNSENPNLLVSTEIDVIKNESKSQNSSTNEPIKQLLEKAKQLLALDKLMTPIGENAFHIYKSVLLVEPHNEQAIQGLKLIQSRYVELAQQAKSEKKYNLVNLYLSRAKTIGPVDDDVAGGFGSKSSPSELDANMMPSSHKSIKRHTLADSQLAEQIRKRYREEYKSEVLTRLERSEPMSASLLALADRFAATEDLLALGSMGESNLQPPIDQYVQAQIHVVQKEYEKARASLESHQLGTHDAWRIRLLGAVCQKLGDYGCAKAQFIQLVASSEAKTSDWLGLAICLDAMGEYENAMESYRKVLASLPANDRVALYVKNRVSDLASQSFNR